VKVGLSVLGYSYGNDNEQDLRGEIIYRKHCLKQQAAQEEYRRSKRNSFEMDNTQKVRLVL